ncbi:MAG: hypothetical protein IPM83_11890 [Ignavibacteria bacterium]|nr:hypothetical protein [Ignavibacteria bacterium]
MAVDGERLRSSHCFYSGIAAAIYRIRFNKGEVIAPLPMITIYRNNFAHMLGVSDDASWKELIRLYLVLHPITKAAT